MKHSVNCAALGWLTVTYVAYWGGFDFERGEEAAIWAAMSMLFLFVGGFVGGLLDQDTKALTSGSGPRNEERG